MTRYLRAVGEITAIVFGMVLGGQSLPAAAVTKLQTTVIPIRQRLSKETVKLIKERIVELRDKATGEVVVSRIGPNEVMLSDGGKDQVSVRQTLDGKTQRVIERQPGAYWQRKTPHRPKYQQHPWFSVRDYDTVEIREIAEGNGVVTRVVQKGDTTKTSSAFNGGFEAYGDSFLVWNENGNSWFVNGQDPTEQSYWFTHILEDAVDRVKVYGERGEWWISLKNPGNWRITD